MTHEIKSYRMSFNMTLEPIKVMLVHKKNELPYEDWLSFVEQTKKSVMNHPEQYLGQHLPQPEEMIALIEQIFEGFLKDRR